MQKHVQIFFISLDARFGRIRKTPKGTPSPQLYTYKKEKLQELVNQYEEGCIDLYFGDGSFVCTEGYVPYGWQFPWEKVTIPSEKRARLNIWGMIDYGSNYHGFSTTQSMTSERIADFLDRFSLSIKRDTFIVLDNAKVHRSKLMKEMREICSFSSCHLIPLTSILQKHFGEYSKASGFSPGIMYPRTRCSMLLTERFRL